MAANDEKEVKTGSDPVAASPEKPVAKTEDFPIHQGKFREEPANVAGPGTAQDKEKEAIAARLAEIRANGGEAQANGTPPPPANGPQAPPPKVVEATLPTAEDERKELADLGFTPAEIELMTGSPKGLSTKKVQIRTNLLKEKSRRRKQRDEEEADRRKGKAEETLDQARDAESLKAKIDALKYVTGETPSRAMKRMGEILAEQGLAPEFGRALARSYTGPEAAAEFKVLILHYPFLTSLACGLGHPVGPVLVRPFGVVGEMGFKALATRVVAWVKAKMARKATDPAPAAAPKPVASSSSSPPPSKPTVPEVPKARPDDDGPVPYIKPPIPGL